MPKFPCRNGGCPTSDGRERSQCSINPVGSIRRIVSSAERKAMETTEILATHLRLAIEVRERMHENDRSATGFLPPPEFEAVADQFFANPHESVRGWERAIDAQHRTVSEVEVVLRSNDADDIAFVGHGGVGTLLLLSLSGKEISRQADQPAGGGNYFAYDIGAARVVRGWRLIDGPAQP